MKDKLGLLLVELSQGLVERGEIIKTALLTVLSGKNLLVVGPPGTGKSLISRRIADAFAGDSDASGYFEYLLTKFSTPEEIFGPLSITELKADRFSRNTQGYLPNVKLAFLDEIFKANSSILNSLLTILNERVFHNGLETQKVPLQALIAASNELPTNQEELSALYDRFLVRCFVDYVKEHNFKELFVRQGEFSLSEQITSSEIASIRDKAQKIEISEQIVDIITDIWQQHKEVFKEDSREQLSDRRLKKVIELLCVSAVTNERESLDLSDILLLKDCLWNHQENAEKVKEIILSTLKNNSYFISHEEAGATSNDVQTSLVGEPDKIIKGLKGSGSVIDPFLIENVHNLFALARPEVGNKGYYFKQTSDIDCSELDTWIEINFKGVYNGNGRIIKYKEVNSVGGLVVSIAGAVGFAAAFSSSTEKKAPALFSNIEQGSKLSNLHLEKLHLANTVVESEISNCSSDLFLINGSAAQSTIKQSKASISLIQDSAINCKILDCSVVSKIDLHTTQDVSKFAFIARTLKSNSEVRRCYISGEVKNEENGDFFISGLVHDCENSQISDCGIGPILTSGSHVKLKSLVTFSCDDTSTIDNNASIDSNRPLESKFDGTKVPAVLFTQYYYEHTLGWNFESVWQWNEDNSQPTLRIGSVNTSQGVDQIDLLTQQIKNNIWL